MINLELNSKKILKKNYTELSREQRIKTLAAKYQTVMKFGDQTVGEQDLQALVLAAGKNSKVCYFCTGKGHNDFKCPNFTTIKLFLNVIPNPQLKIAWRKVCATIIYDNNRVSFNIAHADVVQFLNENPNFVAEREINEEDEDMQG